VYIQEKDHCDEDSVHSVWLLQTQIHNCSPYNNPGMSGNVHVSWVYVPGFKDAVCTLTCWCVWNRNKSTVIMYPKKLSPRVIGLGVCTTAPSCNVALINPLVPDQSYK
jgi:hypothetical protein